MIIRKKKYDETIDYWQRFTDGLILRISDLEETVDKQLELISKSAFDLVRAEQENKRLRAQLALLQSMEE